MQYYVPSCVISKKEQLDVDVSPAAFSWPATECNDLKGNTGGPEMLKQTWIFYSITIDALNPMNKFHNHKCIILRDMNYCPVNFGQVTDGQTEYNAYEPTVCGAQLGPKTVVKIKFSHPETLYLWAKSRDWAQLGERMHIKVPQNITIQ